MDFRAHSDGKGIVSIERRRASTLNITNLDLEAFYNATQVSPYLCSSTAITRVCLPNNLAIIAYGAFSKCRFLTKIRALGAERVCDRAFSFCDRLSDVEMPRVVYIGNAAFEGCRKLKEVVSSALELVGDFAFYNCNNLQHAIYPTASSIGMHAFENCSALSRFLGGPIGVIAHSTFKGSGLQDVFIHRATNHIFSDAFMDCKKLKTITFEAAPTFVSPFAFYGNCKDTKLCLMRPESKVWTLKNMSMLQERSRTETIVGVGKCDRALWPYLAYRLEISPFSQWIMYFTMMSAKRIGLPHIPSEIWLIVERFIF
tara:strand:+ start:516 stop:1457 length:942 start_codon:yes stop_codon:yes gene_type:complete